MLSAPFRAAILLFFLSTPRVWGAPSAPVLSTGTAVGTTSILWNWTAPSDLAAVCPTGTQTYTLFDMATGLPVTSVLHPSVSIQENFGGLPNTRYVRGVSVACSCLGCGTSPLSNSSTIYSLAAAPANPGASSVSTGTIVLNWSANSNPSYTRYEITLSTISYALGVTSQVVYTDNLTLSTKAFTTLSPGTTYFFRIRSFNGSAADASGAQFSALTSTDIPTLPDRAVAAGTALSTGSLRWTWNLVQGATGYRVYSNSGEFMADGPIVAVSSGGLAASAGYGIQVEAYNRSGAGPRGTAFAFTKPRTPINFSIVSADTNTIGISWDADGNAAGTFYEIYTALDPAFLSPIATNTVTQTSASLGGLFPGSTYYVRLRALNGGQLASAFTAIRSTVTPVTAGLSQSTAPASPYATVGTTIGIWHLDASSGTAAVDAGSLSNAGTMTCQGQGCTSTPTFTTGLTGMGNAASFSGVPNAMVRIASLPAYDFTGAITVSAWVRPATASQPLGAAIVAKGTGTYESFALDISSSSSGSRHFRFLVTGPGGAGPVTYVAVATSAIRAGQWDHVIGVYTPAGTPSVKIFVNGSLSNTNATGVAASRVVSRAPITIGSRQSAASSYDLSLTGAADEIRILDRALTDSEAAIEYRSGFPGAVAPPSANGRLVLSIPPNAFNGTAVVFFSADPLREPVRSADNFVSQGLAILPTTQTLIPNSLIEIVPTINGTPYAGDLGSTATLTVPYTDADNDGTVDGTSPPISASSLKLYRLETTVLRWVELATTVDTANKLVTGQTTHFSVFGLFGASSFATALSQARVYPLPWKPGSGTRFDAAGLIFDGLGTSGSIRIYNLAGAEVAHFFFGVADQGRKTWDGRNRDGIPAASGLYFAVVRGSSGNDTALLKFILER